MAEKKTAEKESVTKKTAAKKTATTAAAKKPVATAASAEKAVTKKTPVKKAPIEETEVAKAPEKEASMKVVAGKNVKCPFKKRELANFKKVLEALRSRIRGERSALLGDNLAVEKDPSLSDQGSENFDQVFALSLASSEQDTLFEIEDALRRIEDGTFGICEMSGALIEPARLEALPYTRYSVKAQSELEKGKIKYRPF
jgi:RNA polymerase-binding transcription factor DksA